MRHQAFFPSTPLTTNLRNGLKSAAATLTLFCLFLPRQAEEGPKQPIPDLTKGEKLTRSNKHTNAHYQKYLDQFDDLIQQRDMLFANCAFYYFVDYKNYGECLNWLKIYGMNSILAYLLFSLINFSSITKSVFYGMEQFMGNYYPVLIKLGNVSIIFFILWLMYRNSKFLKV